MSAQTVSADIYLSVSCVALAVQGWALAHLQARRERLVQTGLHRTALCRVVGAITYVYVGLNALVFQWAVLVTTLSAYTLVQLMYMGNAKADVRLKSRLVNECATLREVEGSRVTVSTTAGQDAIVRATIARVIAAKTGDDLKAAIICVETEIVESGIRILANPNVPESMAIPHEGVGEDHASVGPYQQQVPMWGTARDCMDPSASTGKFLAALVRFNWRSLDTGTDAQDVQVSAFPGRYQEQQALATQILKQLWPTTAAPTSEEDDEMILILLAGSPNAYWLAGGKALPSITNGERLAFIAKGGRYYTWGAAQFNLGLQGWR